MARSEIGIVSVSQRERHGAGSIDIYFLEEIKLSVQYNTSEKLSQIEKIITELAILRQKNIQSEGLERRRTETRGERSREEEFRTVFEKIEQKMYLKDKNSAYLWANESYARGLNIVPEEIVGKTDFDFYPSERAQKYVSRTGGSWRPEKRSISKSGRFWTAGNLISTRLKTRPGTITGRSPGSWGRTWASRSRSKPKKNGPSTVCSWRRSYPGARPNCIR